MPVTRCTLTQVFPGIEVVEPLADPPNLASPQHKDNVALYSIARRIAPRIIFEIGTGHGWSAAMLLRHTPSAEALYTIDLPLEDKEQALYPVSKDEECASHSCREPYWYEDQPEARRIIQYHQDTQRFQVPRGLRGNVGLVFVDGGHGYQNCRRDTELAFTMVAPGGAVVWHDYGAWPGVTIAVDEFALTHNVFCLTDATWLAVWRAL